MNRLALAVFSLVAASATAFAEPYTKQMLLEDVSSPGAVITFSPTGSEEQKLDVIKPLRYAGVMFKRLKPCKNRNDIFGDRCSFPVPVQQPSKAFYDAILPITP